MEIKLGDKTYKIFMGLDFVRFLDLQSEMKFDFNITFSTGVVQLKADLELGNPEGIVHFVQAGTCTEPKNKRPTEKEIEEGILKSSQEEMKQLFLSLQKALVNSPMTGQALRGYQDRMSQVMAQIAGNTKLTEDQNPKS